MKKIAENRRTKEEHPILQITQATFKKGTGQVWSEGLQQQWNTSMVMCRGYIGGKILQNCNNADKFIIYTEWESQADLNNFMMWEEYKWYEITDTGNDVIDILYERYVLHQDCMDQDIMITVDEWKKDLRSCGFGIKEPYYRSDRIAGNGVPLNAAAKKRAIEAKARKSGAAKKKPVAKKKKAKSTKKKK